MQIILPPHKKKSAPVTDLTAELAMQIDAMREMLRVQKFRNSQKAYAIAHCQVECDAPYAFFVANPGIFQSDVVINPAVTEAGDAKTVKEGCLSFPFRSRKKVKRFLTITFDYLDANLEPVTETVRGVAAQIVQHEMQHFKGQNIYGI